MRGFLATNHPTQEAPVSFSDSLIAHNRPRPRELAGLDLVLYFRCPNSTSAPDRPMRSLLSPLFEARGPLPFSGQRLLGRPMRISLSTFDLRPTLCPALLSSWCSECFQTEKRWSIERQEQLARLPWPLRNAPLQNSSLRHSTRATWSQYLHSILAHGFAQANCSLIGFSSPSSGEPRKVATSSQHRPTNSNIPTRGPSACAAGSPHTDRLAPGPKNPGLEFTPSLSDRS